ncbi:hypothetical protein QSH39_005165 [Xanthomonas arboricola pv. corylina]|uniref:Uncharacterized protein n=1 Tax=Xanthomonas campestris pv. juglandis TaxID=195709 RepID=A0A8E4EZM2_XANCJ|nr:hypothetical protein AE920_13110 [Xanthomonas arboricola]PPU62862.1 hypothetical protein XacyCFBP1159_03400 [Xanthomonas arboricola pv. corylina]CAD1797971.1 hypothetical protein XSP_004220 [Xanthomonas arboricola pv. juglandis]PPT48292.1 hypothetical protein XarbCFBP8147_16395 [Xanthomonas arboricola]QUI80619.1 hypothetical protein ICA18_21120 [Xanthomonas arboricola pv. corylina]
MRAGKVLESTHVARAEPPPAAMLHCSVICSLMIAIFICEQPGTGRLVDVAMPSDCFNDCVSTCPATARHAERAA